MKRSLLTRVGQRQCVELSGVLNYLQNPRRSDEESELFKQVLPLPNQTTLRKQIKSLVERLNISNTKHDAYIRHAHRQETETE